MSNEPLLEMRSLGRDYGYRPALRALDLTLQSGELICVLGPNGAGKSTLLSTLSAPRPPDRGEILFENRPVRTGAERREYLARIGYLGHEPGLLYDLRAAENLEFFLSLHARSVDAGAKTRVMDYLQRAGLGDRANDFARTFSRGLKQRLGLCRVFLPQPRIVLLDEPLTGLDRAGVQVLRDFLGDFRARGGAGMLATHDDGPFRDLADRFIFIRNGELTADIPRARYSDASRAKAEELLYGTAPAGA